MRPETRNRFLLHVLPAILYCALIFVVSSMEQPPAPDFGLDWGDKINHAGAYAILMILAYRAVRALAPRRRSGDAIRAAFIFTIFYGASDEIHQFFVPGRSCELADWLANVAGALLAAFFILATRNTALARWLYGTPAAPKAEEVGRIL